MGRVSLVSLDMIDMRASNIDKVLTNKLTTSFCVYIRTSAILVIFLMFVGSELVSGSTDLVMGVRLAVCIICLLEGCAGRFSHHYLMNQHFYLPLLKKRGGTAGGGAE